MSYARWGVEGSDVYVYADVAGGVTCQCGSGYQMSADVAIVHLQLHVDGGASVPASVFEEIRRDEAAGDLVPVRSS